VLSMAFCTSAAAASIPWESRTGFLRSGIYGWSYSYDIGFFDGILMIDVDISLTGADPGVDLKSRWESGIEQIWSTDRFGVPIHFNVDWVSGNYDQLVTIVSGAGRWNMRTWYTVDAAGWGDAYQEEVAAHEYGHMISMWDEYAGGAINPVTGLINTGGLMHTLNGPTLNDYYAPFLGWYEDRRAATVPEPSTIVLIAAGIGALILVKSLRKRTEKEL
jgi:PEP-CTERM motif